MNSDAIINQNDSADTGPSADAEKPTWPAPEQHVEFHMIVNGRRAARFAVSAEAATEVERLLRTQGYERKYHGNCRAVMIWGDINHDVYGERIENHRAKEITNLWFPSARAASLHFGLNPDAVSLALHKSAKRGEQVAVVAGVPICWADEVGGN